MNIFGKDFSNYFAVSFEKRPEHGSITIYSHRKLFYYKI